ncbi:hypothetical protein AGMMS50212_02290 [Spirochaetia bacterium]|nr:hypothetical protein AGMMS50212_02290 [Spirochaetia bacterium]
MVFSAYKLDQGNPPKETTLNYGGFAFFDATFVEADIGIKVLHTTNENTILSITDIYFNIGLLGKYPIELDAITLFPLLGFDWLILTKRETKSGSLSLSSERSKFADDKQDWYDYFVLNVGVGADYNITDSFFIRGELLYGFLLNNKSEKDSIDRGSYSTIFKSGPTLKLAAGYKFGQ